jgi:hypothetical protein
MTTKLTIPRALVKKLNCLPAHHMTFDHNNLDIKKILDLTELPLESLAFLKVNPDAELTMFMWAEDAKAKVDLISECAEKNSIALSRIDGVSQLESGDSSSSSLYDLMTFEPVAASGRLNTRTLNLVHKNRHLAKLLSPCKVSLFVALVESEELMKCHKMSNDMAVLDFEVCNFVNKLSISHVQNIKLEQLKYKYLSESLCVHEFDLASQQQEAFRNEVEITIQSSGTVHAILYWFELDYGYCGSSSSRSSKTCTLKHEMFDVAGVLMAEPKQVSPETDDCLCCEVIFEDFMLDLRVSE